MRPSPSIIALLLLACAAGCNPFSRYGPSAQQVVTPPPVFTPADGVVIVGDGAAGPIVLPEGAVPPTDGVVAPAVVPQNNVIVPAVNQDFAWDQIVDVVDDYFDIEREDRMKVIGDVLTEGTIDTFPLTGATMFEPWRRDSVGCYERLESTLQSIRRRAFVRVVPEQGGYLVDVTVIKELEDMPQPFKASAGAATFRYDTSLQRDTEFATDPFRIPGDPARPNGPRTPTLGWIPMGRDPALEQVMLAKIQSRLGGTMTAGTSTTTPMYVPPVVETPNLITPQNIPPGTIVPGVIDPGFPSNYPSTGELPAPIGAAPQPFPPRP